MTTPTPADVAAATYIVDGLCNLSPDVAASLSGQPEAREAIVGQFAKAFAEFMAPERAAAAKRIAELEECRKVLQWNVAGRDEKIEALAALAHQYLNNKPGDQAERDAFNLVRDAAAELQRLTAIVERLSDPRNSHSTAGWSPPQAAEAKPTPPEQKGDA